MRAQGGGGIYRLGQVDEQGADDETESDGLAGAGTGGHAEVFA
jgi:hypothetical protein